MFNGFLIDIDRDIDREIDIDIDSDIDIDIDRDIDIDIDEFDWTNKMWIDNLMKFDWKL